MGRGIGWLARRALLFVALATAIMIFKLASPSFQGLDDLRRTATVLAEGQRALTTAASSLTAWTDSELADAHRLGRTALADRRAAKQREHDMLATACGSDLTALLGAGPDGVIENRVNCLRATLIAREVTTLDLLAANLNARRPGETVQQAVYRHVAMMRRAAAVYRDARSRLSNLRSDHWPDLLESRQIEAEQAREKKALAVHAKAQAQGLKLLAVQNKIDAATREAAGGMERVLRPYRELAASRSQALAANGIERMRVWAVANDVPGVLRLAAWALLGIILSPVLIRLFCYYVLVPAAMRRPALRLSAGSDVPIPPVARSGVSVALQLATGEELLVRQDYLQTTSLVAKSGTRWLLDPWRPLTSFATGLTFLTRIEGSDGTTTISARRDPHAEVTVIALPAGAACMLQPRALAAVVHFVDRPLKVTSRWRLGSLNAWLTLQLRYLIFHGPARLIVKGGRGVRVEPAANGRVFGQDQLIGFSADLDYAVTRTETFWPYLLGRELLFKDRVDRGTGVIVLEEAPLSTRGGARARRGIEGMIDASMKLVGM